MLLGYPILFRMNLKSSCARNQLQNISDMKKPFDKTVVGRILIGVGKVALGIFLKRQKFNKTEKDEKRIDDILDKF